MIFATRQSYKLSLLSLVVIGFVSLIFIFYGFGSKAEYQQHAVLGLLVGVLLLCFGLPYYMFRYMKVIEVKNGIWTIGYPKLNRSIRITKSDIRKVEILNTTRTGKQINIRLNDSSSIYISESQIKGFKKLANLASRDFKELVHRTD